jgi:serine/threonine protein kinase
LEQMGKYQLVRRLAVGGMAEVFLAKAAGPMGFEKELVVKRILPHLAEDPQFVEMFLTEAKLAARLNHGNVVQIFDFGAQEDSYFIAMEYVDGLNLKALLKRAAHQGTPIPYPLAARIISLACEGLAYAHDLVDPQTAKPLGFIHRDISADNILVSLTGGVKVVDFGIAKAANMGQQTQSGVLKGKVSYMPPEYLLNNPIDLRADIYALGVVLYELIAGRRPFEAESEVQLVQLIIQGKAADLRALRPNVPDQLVQIIERSLQKNRDARYANCRQFQADLERFLIQHGEPVGAQQLGEWVKVLASVDLLPPRRRSQESPVVAPSGDVASSSGTRSLRPSQPSDLAQSLEETLVTPPPVTSVTENDEELLKLIARPQWHRFLAISVAVAALAGAALYFFTQNPTPRTSEAAVPSVQTEATPLSEKLPTPPAAAPEVPPSIVRAPPPAPVAEPPPSNPSLKAEENSVGAAQIHEPAGQQEFPKDSSMKNMRAQAAKAPGRQASPRSPTQLRVESNLPAHVLIDGSFVGNTPLRMEMTPGRKQIEVTGKIEQRSFNKIKTVDITNGESRVVFTFRLINVQVRGLPANMKVLALDDESLDHEDRVLTYEGLHSLLLVRVPTGQTFDGQCEVKAAEKVCMLIQGIK